jgi:hypothetical protein
MMAQVRAPRNVFLNFPLGHQCGKANDADLQTKILKDALGHLAAAKTPGEFADLAYQWDESFDWACYLSDVEDMLKAEGAAVQEWKPKD